jgi:hypothetical protein
MKAGTFASPNTSVAVFAFAVHGIGEAFTQDAPLHGEVFVSVERRAFIGTPAHGTMVYNDVAVLTSPHGIVFAFLFIAHAATDEPDDYVIGFNYQ